MQAFAITVVLNAVAVWVATQLVAGLSVTGQEVVTDLTAAC